MWQPNCALNALRHLNSRLDESSKRKNICVYLANPFFNINGNIFAKHTNILDMLDNKYTTWANMFFNRDQVVIFCAVK